MGKASKRMSLIKGRIVNLDTHYSAYWGDSEIGKDNHPYQNILKPLYQNVSAEMRKAGHSPTFS